MAQEHRVSYNDKAFLIDGQPGVVISGAIHYFRVPRRLWRDRPFKGEDGGHEYRRDLCALELA